MMRRFLIVTCLIVFAGAAHAGTWGERARLVMKNSPDVRVQVFNDVKDGCWPDAAATKALIQNKLVRSGVPVKNVKTNPLGLTLTFRALGYGMVFKGRDVGCSVAFRFSLSHAMPALAPNKKTLPIALIESFAYFGMKATPTKASMQLTLDEQAGSHARQFVEEWRRARGE